MVAWDDFLIAVKEYTRSSRCDLFFFRGHNNSEWKLNPLIYRVKSTKWRSPLHLEQALHIDFKSNCGPLYEKNLDSWELLLEMRHAGLPTRLLDWTETFSSALFFALRGVDWTENKDNIQPCVWIMDPNKLYKKFYKKMATPVIDHLDFEYEDIVDKKISRIKERCPGPLPLIVPRNRPRIFAQKSFFTLHPLDYGPIEKICKECVKKFDIPLNSIEDAKQYLELSGINEYTMFPDLDGLGRRLKSFHKIREK